MLPARRWWCGPRPCSGWSTPPASRLPTRTFICHWAICATAFIACSVEGASETRTAGGLGAWILRAGRHGFSPLLLLLRRQWHPHDREVRRDRAGEQHGSVLHRE